MYGPRAGGGFSSRGGLSNRPGPSDQVQISVDPGNQFDLDTEIDGLRGQLSRLKQVSSAIHEEQTLQNSIAASLEETLEKAKLGLGRTMRRLNRTYQHSNSNHLLYLLLFVVGVFFIMYWWMKFYKLVTWKT